MQGDLISRSRVIETIWDVFNSYANDSQRFDEYETEAINNAFTVLQKCVENQPPSYSVIGVVCQIHNKFEGYLDEIIDNPEKLDKVDFLLKQNNEICNLVRNGGKE